jgi:peptide-methionine (R)-S-oxide reductase
MLPARAALPIDPRRPMGFRFNLRGRQVDKIDRTNSHWRAVLTPAQYDVLREEGTERPHSSPLNQEKRKGTFVCSGCGQPLFKSDTKYDSRTGWPSFYASIPGAVETKVDRKLLMPRTEYHCARCGGHQGHVFEDGPAPTGQRFCNNGLALRFEPD